VIWHYRYFQLRNSPISSKSTWRFIGMECTFCVTNLRYQESRHIGLIRRLCIVRSTRSTISDCLEKNYKNATIVWQSLHRKWFHEPGWWNFHERFRARLSLVICVSRPIQELTTRTELLTWPRNTVRLHWSTFPYWHWGTSVVTFVLADHLYLAWTKDSH